jgi:acetoin utilization protein AcuB
MISLTGVGKRGIQFAFQVEDRPGSIKDIADIMRKFGGRMVSILSTYERVPQGYRKVYIRMYGVDRSKLEQLKAEMKAKATVLYMVDHRENKREIYQEEM